MNRYVLVCVDNIIRNVQYIWDGAKWIKTHNEEMGYRFIQREVAERWVIDHPTVIPDNHTLDVRTI